MDVTRNQRGLQSMSSMKPRTHYFTDLTCGKLLLYVAAGLYVIGVGLMSMIEPFLEISCTYGGEDLGFPNPAYDGTRCPHIRYTKLLGFTPMECAFARRLVASCFLGGLIGWERREADRPAGIRTMSLVSLGSCLFTINSAFAFLNGPMTWDASRVSAAIPSGVGFLGAGLIFKKEEKNDSGDSAHVVHGLTTAASLWLSAAVGIACGGDLFMPASFGVAIMLLLLRFGPRGTDEDEKPEDEDDHNDLVQDDQSSEGRSFHNTYSSVHHLNESSETMSLTESQRRTDKKSIRKRQANLGSIV